MNIQLLSVCPLRSISMHKINLPILGSWEYANLGCGMDHLNRRQIGHTTDIQLKHDIRHTTLQSKFAQSS